jgi:hypothetical protein
MERNAQQFPKLITMEDWLSKVPTDAPTLPWLDCFGIEICSFCVMSNEEPDTVTVPFFDLSVAAPDALPVAFFDAHGRQTSLREEDILPMRAAAIALNPTPHELTFLPRVVTRIEINPTVLDPAALPRSMEGEGLSIVVGEYTEAGWFKEANVVKITDGERTALYVPFKTVAE